MLYCGKIGNFSHNIIIFFSLLVFKNVFIIGNIPLFSTFLYIVENFPTNYKQNHFVENCGKLHNNA